MTITNFKDIMRKLNGNTMVFYKMDKNSTEEVCCNKFDTLKKTPYQFRVLLLSGNGGLSGQTVHRRIDTDLKNCYYTITKKEFEATLK